MGIVRRYQRPGTLQAEAIFNLYNPLAWGLLFIAAALSAVWYALAGAWIAVRELVRDTVIVALDAERATHKAQVSGPPVVSQIENPPN